MGLGPELQPAAARLDLALLEEEPPRQHLEERRLAGVGGEHRLLGGAAIGRRLGEERPDHQGAVARPAGSSAREQRLGAGPASPKSTARTAATWAASEVTWPRSAGSHGGRSRTAASTSAALAREALVSRASPARPASTACVRRLGAPLPLHVEVGVARRGHHGRGGHQAHEQSRGGAAAAARRPPARPPGPAGSARSPRRCGPPRRRPPPARRGATSCSFGPAFTVGMRPRMVTAPRRRPGGWAAGRRTGGAGAGGGAGAPAGAVEPRRRAASARPAGARPAGRSSAGASGSGPGSSSGGSAVRMGPESSASDPGAVRRRRWRGRTAGRAGARRAARPTVLAPRRPRVPRRRASTRGRRAGASPSLQPLARLGERLADPERRPAGARRRGAGRGPTALKSPLRSQPLADQVVGVRVPRVDGDGLVELLPRRGGRPSRGAPGPG